MRDVEVYWGLLEEFIAKTIRPDAGQLRLEITTLRIILDRSSKVDPLLLKVSLSDNGRLTCDLPDGMPALQALRVYLQKVTDFISSLIGEEVAREFIKDFVRENESIFAENVMTRPSIVASLPEPFKELSSHLIKEEGKVSDHQEIIHLFTEVFNTYLKDLSKHTDLSAFKLKLGILREENKLLRTMNLRKNNTVEIDPASWARAPDQEVGAALAAAFNSLVGLSSFMMGKEEATRKGVQALRENFAGRDELLSRYIPLDSILEGALRQKVSTGIPALDSRMKGGLPKGSSVLLLSPGGIERDLFIAQMILNGVSQDGSVIYVTSRDHPRSFKHLLRNNGLDPERLEEAGRLRIVDWFSWRGERIIGVERDGYGLKSSKILSNLGIAIGKAIREIRFSNVEIACLQVITSAVNIFDFPQVYNFLLRLRVKFRDEGITAFFLIETGSIGPEEIQRLKEAFDGFLELKRTETPTGIDREIEVHALSSVDFDHRPVPLMISECRLIEHPYRSKSARDDEEGATLQEGKAAQGAASIDWSTGSPYKEVSKEVMDGDPEGVECNPSPPPAVPAKVGPAPSQRPEQRSAPDVILAPPVRMKPVVKRKVISLPERLPHKEGGDRYTPERLLAEAMETIDQLLEVDPRHQSSAVRPIKVRKKT